MLIRFQQLIRSQKSFIIESIDVLLRFIPSLPLSSIQSLHSCLTDCVFQNALHFIILLFVLNRFIIGTIHDSWIYNSWIDTFRVYFPRKLTLFNHFYKLDKKIRRSFLMMYNASTSLSNFLLKGLLNEMIERDGKIRHRRTMTKNWIGEYEDADWLVDVERWQFIDKITEFKSVEATMTSLRAFRDNGSSSDRLHAISKALDRNYLWSPCIWMSHICMYIDYQEWAVPSWRTKDVILRLRNWFLKMHDKEQSRTDAC